MHVFVGGASVGGILGQHDQITKYASDDCISGQEIALMTSSIKG